MSFEVRAHGQNPADQVARALSGALAQVGKPAGALVFASGPLAGKLDEIATAAARVAAGTPLLVVSGAGVLSERGEIEGHGAATGIVWAGGEAEALTSDASTPDDLGEALARQIGDRVGRRAPAVLVFVKPEGFDPAVLEPLRQTRGTEHVIGAGVVGEPGLFAVDRTGRVSTGGGVGLVLRGVPPPLIRTSPACRLLAPFRPITETRGSMVVRVGDEAALDLLTAVGERLEDQPLLFAVLAEEAGPDDPPGRPPLLVRGVQGVDPVRRGLMISGEVREGMRLSFAVRDASAARADLTSVARQMRREIAGAAPRFGIYINCAGRGANLYGADDVDTRLIKGSFGDIPLAGMQSAFEIAPHAGRPSMHLYTGVVVLFTAPS